MSEPTTPIVPAGDSGGNPPVTGEGISMDSFTPEHRSFVQSNFRDFAGDDYKGHASMADFNSLDDMMKSGINTQQMVGKKLKDFYPQEGWETTQLDDFHKNLGWSPNTEDYNLDLSDEIQFDKTNAHLNENSGSMLKAMIGAHIPKDKARELFKTLVEGSMKETANRKALQAEERKAGFDAYKSELGEAYKPKVAEAYKVFKDVFGAEYISYLKKTGQDGPETLGAALKLAKRFAPDKINKNETGASSFTPRQYADKARKMLEDKKDPLNIKGHINHDDRVKLYSEYANKGVKK